MINPEESALVSMIDSDIRDGELYGACQVAVFRDGVAVLDHAAGRDHRGRLIRSDSLTALYCAAKPLGSVAALALIDAGELSADDKLAHLIDGCPPAWGAVTVESLLAHRSGAPGDDGFSFRLTPPTLRWSKVAAAAPRRSGRRTRYSEFTGWYLLGHALECVTGLAYDQLLEELVVRPLGLRSSEILTGPVGAAWCDYGDRLVARRDVTGARPYTLLAEAAREVYDEFNPGFGGCGSMRAMAEFYARLLQCMEGERDSLSSSVLRWATASSGPVFDETTAREVGLGKGFMTELETWGYGRALSGRAFGHSGHEGTTATFADPDAGLAAAVWFDTIVDYDTATLIRRPRLVRAIYDEFGRAA